MALSHSEKYFNRFFWLTSAIIFIIICLRAFLIPFSHDEAATFFFYVQSDNYLPYKAHLYTNNHVLNSALANVFYHLAGSHRFVLRLPNIFAFLVFCFGIYRHLKHLQHSFSKIILAAFFLLTFNFLDFFELCRGYGLSMAFLLLGLSYLVDYFETRKFKLLIFFSFLAQLALSANLILVVVLTILLGLIFIFQIGNKLFFKPGNIILQLINLGIVFFWVKFSLFYQEQGKLDYGVGDNYWHVSFESLLFLLFNSTALWLQIMVITLFAFITISTLSTIILNRVRFEKLFQPQTFYPLLLIITIIAFYLQKIILNVNFPEDRTGLFFFLFFVLSFSFVIDAHKFLSSVIAVCVVLSLLIHFCFSLNFSNFTSLFYHTMPKASYDVLLNEFAKSNQLFTIGGHRIREMNYAFLNYRGQSMLNPMDQSEEMQMNCDYYFAMKAEKPYYQYFYDEIAFDQKWDRVLLKRKEKIEHAEFYSLLKPKVISGNEEFLELRRIKDTIFTENNPIELETEITFEKVPVPFNGSLVMEIQNEKGEQIWYKRILLNWLAADLNGHKRFLKLTTGNLPPKTTVIVYFWNIDKNDVRLKVNSLKLYQLKGKGVNFRVPVSFYELLTKTTHKPLL